MYYDAENRSKQQEETRIQQKLQQVLTHKEYFEQEIKASQQKLPQKIPFQQNNLYQEEEDKTLEGRDFTICIRARPMLKHEIQKNYFTITTANNPDMVLHNAKLNVKCQPVVEDQNFSVDYAFGPEDSNEVVYQQTGKPLIKLALEGGLGAMFAYGQTGSGKTFTMQGVQKLVAHDVFKYNKEGHDIFVGFFELLGNKASCLLENSNKVDILEDQFGKVQAKGVKEVQVTNGNQFLDLINTAQQNRKTQATFKNDVSSRTHSIAQVRIKNNRVPAADDGYLYIIDLVGSENASDSQFHDQKLFKETKDINKSLMALKECIRNRALASVDSKYIHVPFRQSKLTLLLKDSFDMDSFRQTKTVVIANIAPSIADKEQTINTLRYAAPIKISTKNKKPMPINPENPQFWENDRLQEYLRKVCLKYNKKNTIDIQQFMPFETGKQALMIPEADFIQRLVSLQYPEKNAKQVHDQFFKKFIDNRFADRKKLQNKAGKLVQPEMNFQGKHTDTEDIIQQKQNLKKQKDKILQKQIFENQKLDIDNQENQINTKPLPKKQIKQPPSQKPFQNSKSQENQQNISQNQQPEPQIQNNSKPLRQKSPFTKDNINGDQTQNTKRISNLASQGQQIVKGYQEKQKKNRENLEKIKEERKQKMIEQQKAQEEKHFQQQQLELQQKEQQQIQQSSLFNQNRQDDLNLNNLSIHQPKQQQQPYNMINPLNNNSNNNKIQGFQGNILDQEELKYEQYRQRQQIQKNQIEDLKVQQRQQQAYYQNQNNFQKQALQQQQPQSFVSQQKVQGFSDQGLQEEEQRYFQFKRKEQETQIQHQKQLISQQQKQIDIQKQQPSIYDKTQELPSFPPQKQFMMDNNQVTEYNNMSNNYSQKPPRQQWNKQNNINLPNLMVDQNQNQNSIQNNNSNNNQFLSPNIPQQNHQQHQSFNYQPLSKNNVYDELMYQQKRNSFANNNLQHQQGMNYYPTNVNNINNINGNNNRNSPYHVKNKMPNEQQNNYNSFNQMNSAKYNNHLDSNNINMNYNHQQEQVNKYSNLY